MQRSIWIYLMVVGPQATALAQTQQLERGRVVTEQLIGIPLGRIGSMAPWRDGTLAVALLTEPRLVIVRGTERPLFFSRAGGGPGELRLPGTIGWIGDTLWVGDASLGRVTLFTATGRLIRSIPVQVGGSPILLRGGITAVMPMPAATVAEQKPTVERIQRVVNGRMEATLLSVIKRYRAWSVAVGQGHMVGQQPFDDFPLWRAFPSGTGFVLVKREATSRRPTAFTVQRFSETGKLLFDRTYPYIPVSLGKAEIQAAVSRLIFDLPASGGPGFRQRAMDALYRPPYLPAVNAVIAGVDGSIWIEREHTTAAMARWMLLTASGERVGDFLIPAGVEVRAGTAGSLWGVAQDADGVPSIVEYRFPK